MAQLDQIESKLFKRDETSRNELTLVHLSPNGPVIKELGIGSSPLESQAIPEEQLFLAQRLALEALPVLPEGRVCAPLTKEEEKSLGPGPYNICKAKEASHMTEWEKAQFRETSRLHLHPGEKVARTPDGGYLIIDPIFQHLMDSGLYLEREGVLQVSQALLLSQADSGADSDRELHHAVGTIGKREKRIRTGLNLCCRSRHIL